MIKITFIGDIVCDKKMLQEANKNYEYNFDNMFFPLKDYFKNSDYVVGNLETVISNKKFTKSSFSFCNPEQLIISLKKIGVNVLSLANNHIYDRKEKGIIDTIKYLEKHNINYFGISNNYDIDLSGNKITILGYTDSTNYHINKVKLNDNSKYKVNILKKERLIKNKNIFFKLYRKVNPDFRLFIKRIRKQEIKPIIDNEQIDNKSITNICSDIYKLKKQGRYVIAYPHIGGQYNIEPGLYTNNLIKELKKVGCDSIVITHPHIIQKVKTDYCYSIGDVIISPKSNYVLWKTLPEYSMVINYYFDNNKIKKISISFLICVSDKNTYLKIYPFYDYYNNLSDNKKNEVKKTFNEVYKRVFDSNCRIQKEYVIGKW